MKRILFLVPLLFLIGCVPDSDNKFPDIPPSLIEACPSLKNVPENTVKLSEAIGIISENYFQYHECRAKVDLWIDWYKLQKRIYENKW